MHNAASCLVDGLRGQGYWMYCWPEPPRQLMRKKTLAETWRWYWWFRRRNCQFDLPQAFLNDGVLGSRAAHNIFGQQQHLSSTAISSHQSDDTSQAQDQCCWKIPNGKHPIPLFEIHESKLLNFQITIIVAKLGISTINTKIFNICTNLNFYNIFTS